MIRHTIFVLIFLIGLSFSAVSLAQPVEWPSLAAAPTMEKLGANDVAVIVAIEEYAFLPNVPGARQNAEDWSEFFRTGLGINSVYLLTDQDAAHEEMLRMAREAASEVEESGTLWFIFIGHGAPSDDGEDGSLIGMDARQTTAGIHTRGLSQSDLLSALETGSQANTVVVLDACFSGRTGDGESLAPGVQPVLPIDFRPDLESNTVILSAARSDQYAGPLPGTSRPAFSYLLLGALRGWANDRDGTVTAGGAVHYTHQQLRRVPGRHQTPQLAGTGDLILVRGAVEPDPTRAQPDRRTAEAPVAVEEVPARLELQEIEMDETALDYMRGICGNDAAMTESSGWGNRSHESAPGCSSCPSNASGATGSLILNSGFVGDFYGDGSEYAILETTGCGYGIHADRSTSVVKRVGESWVMTDYSDGGALGECESIRFPDKDRLLCGFWEAGQGWAHLYKSVIALHEGEITRDELPDWDIIPESDPYYREGASPLRDFSGAGTFWGYFDVSVTTPFTGDISGNGVPEIAMGITAKQGTPLRHVDLDEDFFARENAENFNIEELRFLRIWTLESGEFQRSRELEDAISHPYLRRYAE